jgi:sec-independent protein translocase protein TatA
VFGLGGPELIIILAIILIIFGPKQLPKLGKMIGTTMKGLREGAEGKEDEAEAPKEVVKAEATPSESAKSEAKATGGDAE